MQSCLEAGALCGNFFPPFSLGGGGYFVTHLSVGVRTAMSYFSTELTAQVMLGHSYTTAICSNNTQGIWNPIVMSTLSSVPRVRQVKTKWSTRHKPTLACHLHIHGHHKSLMDTLLQRGALYIYIPFQYVLSHLEYLWNDRTGTFSRAVQNIAASSPQQSENLIWHTAVPDKQGQLFLLVLHIWVYNVSNYG